MLKNIIKIDVILMLKIKVIIKLISKVYRYLKHKNNKRISVYKAYGFWRSLKRLSGIYLANLFFRHKTPQTPNWYNWSTS
jgi:hypothetical protein